MTLEGLQVPGRRGSHWGEEEKALEGGPDEPRGEPKVRLERPRSRMFPDAAGYRPPWEEPGLR